MNLPINKLTKIFTIILLLSLVLTSMGLNDVFRNDAFVTPFSILLSQTIWNAAKVFFLFTLGFFAVCCALFIMQNQALHVYHIGKDGLIG